MPSSDDFKISNIWKYDKLHTLPCLSQSEQTKVKFIFSQKKTSTFKNLTDNRAIPRKMATRDQNQI